MQIFYAPDITGDTYDLNENESKHLIRVLRMMKGDEVRLIDGKGNLFEGIIRKPDKHRCIIEITGKTEGFERRSYRLHIAISPLKNPERFEWFIEKSVEIGVDEITPLICKHTEKQSVKDERINNLIISAMKQSMKATKTILNKSSSLSEFLDKSLSDKSLKMIATCDQTLGRNAISDLYKKGSDVIILIGPEGDFTAEEVASAVAKEFLPVHLGPSRLRTETAGIAACHSIYFLNQ